MLPYSFVCRREQIHSENDWRRMEAFGLGFSIASNRRGEDDGTPGPCGPTGVRGPGQTKLLEHKALLTLRSASYSVTAQSHVLQLKRGPIPKSQVPSSQLDFSRLTEFFFLKEGESTCRVSKIHNTGKKKQGSSFWAAWILTTGGVKDTRQQSQSHTKQKLKWRCGGSNPVPLACKASALPFELHPLIWYIASILFYYQWYRKICSTLFSFLENICSTHWTISFRYPVKCKWKGN